MIKIGKYKLLKNKRFRISAGVLYVNCGYIVSVRQIDNTYNKVLIDFGDGDIEWFYKSCMNDIEYIGGLDD